MAAKPFIYQFYDVRVDAVDFRIFKNGEILTLEPKAFQVLLFLLEERGRLITKEELLDAVWKDSFVTPNALTRLIAQLRRALGDASQNSRMIETVPTRGYRFIAETQVFEIAPKNAGFWAAVENVQKEISDAESSGSDRRETAETSDFAKPRDDAAALSFNFSKRLISIVLIALLLTLTTGGIFYFVFTKNNGKPATTTADSSEQTLAVLPFKLLSPTDENYYLSIGLADSLITKLSSIRSLSVRPTSAVLRYVPAETDAANAGRELKVETVIEGIIQKVGDRVRVSVQLIRAADGKALWANSFDTQFVNIFQVQDEISARITDALKIRLTDQEETRLNRRPTDNIEAYQLCLRAHYHLYRLNPADMQMALDFFNQAIALDPTYALAYAELARAYGIASSFNFPQAAALGEKAANKAIELDPNLGEAYAAIAAIQFWTYRDAGKAQDSFVHALELNPNSAAIHEYYAWFLVATGHFDEAERHMRRALELDPLSPGTNNDQGLPLLYARRYDEARAKFTQSLEFDKNLWFPHMRIGEACEGEGDYVCSVNEFEFAVKASMNDPSVKALLARSLALAGRKDEARRIITELTAPGAPPPSHFSIALVYTALGETDQAYASLERALADGDKWLPWAKVDPRLDALRQDKRFDDFLMRSNLK
jgi:TolB-like protein/DNA-binding winged helix-turn-helix (wHTH) protein/Tfp pilus assembly protein PilF